ncbi:hypothetical protein [Paraburkholderia lycopersici]|uniref:Uncharacterized protein n=1 Tax=Paraburkholderia lycopersici TaxID=416944 RepID=A0A1G6IPA7_9BURK|nr:hypothetical protein [Paraburkholderia lycopersici]SDC08251.1 hypothetical protein SAMN05421548_10413 [Paraburkholderia lycopersici]
MSILDWIRPRARENQASESPQISTLIERLLVLSPTLKLVPEWRGRLAPALGHSVAYVRDVVDRMPSAREASAATWLSDPYIHAFFAAPDEVGHVLSRSLELHAWFDDHPLARETYGVLGMAVNERRAFGVEQHGDEVHTDVMQTTLSFDDHQVRVCGETEGDLREQIVQRVVEQIALAGLEQIGADESRRDALEQERALLRTRLQLLTRHGAGTQRMLGEQAMQNAAEVAKVEAQIAENERDIAELGLKSEALEHELAVICDVLASPAQYANVEMREICLSPMNVVLESGGPCDSASIVFPLARLPASPQGLRAFSLVRFARADLQPLPRVLVEDSRFMI